MIKVILVDDEEIIRTGISKIIDWKKAGCELTAVFENGKQAFDYLCSYPADIVITDIKMPVMDGIQLVKESNYHQLPAKFILLSGYGEFEYAKAAMEYGVQHYILKPSDETQIIQALRALIEKIQEEKQMLHTMNNSKQNMHKLLPAAKEMFLSNFILQDACKDNQTSIINTIMKLVDEDISNPCLSLKWIARNKLYMSEDYLSKLFSKNTGMKFTKYLTEQKINYAKKYLRENPDIKVIELCDALGFENNPTYLSTLFKNHTGMTLTDYRRQLL